MPQDSILRVQSLTNNISPFQSQKPRFLPPPFSIKFSSRTSCFSSLNHVSSHVPRTSFSYTRVYVPLVHDIITKAVSTLELNPDRIVFTLQFLAKPIRIESGLANPPREVDSIRIRPQSGLRVD